MARLIDAELLTEHLFANIEYDKTVDDGIEKTDKEAFAFKCGWNDALKSVMENAPTVDAEPVRHGRWIYTPTEPLGYVCSECGKSSCSFTYCPNCGANMDESKEQSKAETKERGEDG